MQPFTCSVCGQILFFQNSTCLRCGSGVGYDPAVRELGALRPIDDGSDDRDLLCFVDGRGPGHFRACGNVAAARCNWLIAVDDPLGCA